jgi:hypothetical protein
VRAASVVFPERKSDHILGERSVVLVTLYADSLNTVLPMLSSNTYKLIGIFMYVTQRFIFWLGSYFLIN